tara:strand:+ start:750 stop:1199 length:450 start_codon:yes stop_codon:yes gene_type:complete
MEYSITNIEYDKGHSDLPKSLTMTSENELTEDALEHEASEFISNETGFCHKGFTVDLIKESTQITKVIQTNIGKMTFADRNTELTTSVILKYLMPLLETVYEKFDIISVNKASNTLRLLVNGDVVRFSYDIVTASRKDDPHGFRLLGRI